jgi:hypothetical protein
MSASRPIGIVLRVLPELRLKSKPSERTGEAAALRALSWGAARVDQAVSLATTAKLAGFTAENRESLAFIKESFVTNNSLAFVAVVGTADHGCNRPTVFVYIVHYIEPSGRQPFCIHKGTGAGYS